MCKSGKMITGGDTIPIAVKTFNVKGKGLLDTRSIELQSEAESYAKTASIVADITEKFNIKSPKSLNFNTPLWIAELVGEPIMIEPLLEGQSWKYINNRGYRLQNTRMCIMYCQLYWYRCI